MNIRKLAIVGRPNVGKSALFNRICKKRIAIVDEMEGVTRDRNYAAADVFGYPFVVIDSGGINPKSSDEFNKEVVRQARIAIEEADALVMVVDSRIGVTDLDERLAKELVRTGKPVTLAVNKVDNMDQEIKLHEFYGLGIRDIVPVSATQNYNIAELLETSLDSFRHEVIEEEERDGVIKVSVIGRANVGKSTLLNSLLDDERCLVSPKAGTTRDSVDIPFAHDGQDFLLIDTAGIRRKNAEKDVVEKFAAIRTEESIEKSDICILMIDAREGISTQDKRIAAQIEKAGKGCIVLANKWDLVKGFRMEACLKGIRRESPFLGHCPVLFISARTGRNLQLIIPEVKKVFTALTQKITTHGLNTFVERAIQLNHPPMIKGKRLRIYYLTQVSSSPPNFVLFVNHPDLMTETYKKYLINQFRIQYDFLGTPLKLRLRGKKKKERASISRSEGK